MFCSHPASPDATHPEGYTQLELCSGCLDIIEPPTWEDTTVWRNNPQGEDQFCRLCAGHGPACEKLVYCDNKICAKGYCSG